MTGIETFGYYLPRFSIRAEEYAKEWGYFAGRDVEEKTVPGFDEDEATMAVEAAQRALDLAGPAASGVEFLAVASGSAVRPPAPTVAAALGLPGVRTASFIGDRHGGVTALAAALDALEARGGSALAVSADQPRVAPDDPAEHALGAGAAAFVLSREAPVEVVARSSSAGEAYAADEADLLRARVEALADSLGEQPVWAALPQPGGRLPQAAMRELPIHHGADEGTARFTGDLAGTTPLLNLVVALTEARQGEAILVGGAGGGAATALLFRVKAKASGVGIITGEPKEDRTYLSYGLYARLRGFMHHPTPGELTSQGAYVSPQAYQHTVPQRYRLLGQRCGKCGRLIFPRRDACPSCGSNELEETALPRRGEVYSYTIIARGSSPTEFKAQQEMAGEYSVAIVELAEGLRIIAQLTDVDPTKVSVGMPVAMVFRRLYQQDSVVRYGFKFKPWGRGSMGPSLSDAGRGRRS